MNYRILFGLKILILFILSTVPIQAQDAGQISDIQNQLQKIENEIEALKDKQETEQKKLNNEMSSLKNIDRQIALTGQKMNLYEKEIRGTKSELSRIEDQIQIYEKQLSAMKGLFASQIQVAYKISRQKKMDWIIGAANFNEAYLRYHYFKKFAALEKETYFSIQKISANLQEKQLEADQKIKKQERLLASLETENENHKKRKSSKNQLIKKISGNQKLLARAIDEQQKSYRELADLIARLEQKKPRRNLKKTTQLKWESLSGSFQKNIGKLNWPVNGSIIHKFGRYKNPKLKTVLNNAGIDIQAPRNENVRCVFSGVISLITYMGGFGNTVIVDHNNGYYTVYSHLQDIYVNEGDFIESGTVLGSVGETGSLEGPKLHFEIYANNQPQDPQKWLNRSQ